MIFDKVWPRHCLSALLCKICISPKVTKNNFIGIFYVLVYSMFKLEWWEEIQWRNGDFAALLRWRSGRAFDKNVPNIFCQKMTFFDQRPVFNELFSKNRTFWVFLRPIDRNMWKKYFFRNIFLDNIFLLTSCGMQEMQEYPFSYWTYLRGWPWVCVITYFLKPFLKGENCSLESERGVNSILITILRLLKPF